jgi:hypothetical protein
MKTLKYILIVVVLTCSVTAYGRSKVSFSIGIVPQPAYRAVYVYQQPVCVYQQPVVVYTCPQPVYTYARPVYVAPAPVYVQPEVSFSFSTFWGGGGHSYYGGHRSDNGGWRGHR